MARLADAARPRDRASRLRCPPRQVEAMNLADYRVAGHPLRQFCSDLAGAQPLVPQPLQKVDPLIRPGHFLPSVAFAGYLAHAESLIPRPVRDPARFAPQLT